MAERITAIIFILLIIGCKSKEEKQRDCFDEYINAVIKADSAWRRYNAAAELFLFYHLHKDTTKENESFKKADSLHNEYLLLNNIAMKISDSCHNITCNRISDQ